MPTTIGVIGTGNMGSALVRGWLRAEDQEIRLVVWDEVEAAVQGLLSPGPISPAGSLKDLVAQADVVLVVVKPKDASEVLGAIAPLLRPEQWVISSMAGVTTEQIRALLGPGPRVLRVMPNLGVELGVGAIAVAAEPGTPDAELQVAAGLFSGLGVTESVPEGMLDAVTAVSGSGPAFLALAVEALEDGAVASGLPRTTARRVVRETALAAAGRMPLAPDVTAELQEDTDRASKEAACAEAAGADVLAERAVQAAFRQAIESAVGRSRLLRGLGTSPNAESSDAR